MNKKTILINEIETLLPRARASERFNFTRQFESLRKKADFKQADWSTLKNRIDNSIQTKLDRQANLPDCHFDNDLPINQHQSDIASAIENNQVVIICGETGSGKTTQLPKLCLTLGRGIDGYIGHTQPRRIAAKTVAKRIADELQSELGSHVGYKIRHQDISNKNSYIKLMTDGILLAELQQDRYLNQYDTLIIDEAHERSLNIDFILGYLKQLLPRRPDLKVIITSATIDVERFSEHFNKAPVIEVSGRSYPVDVLYRPIEDDEENEDERGREGAIVDAINELASFDMGDILIFLEGEGEIHETDKFLRKQNLPDTDVLPLYARLSSSRQNKIFAPHKRRHIVLATNIAETSLTIPGIRYVIDSGMARISRYSYRSKVQRLPIEKVSKAAANQRKGRCGRTSDGICIRLYSEEDFESRTEFTQPEILRTNLASVILQMKALNIGDIENYPFINPPEKKLINDGMRVLQEINALDKHNKLTSIGRKIARFPLDPRHARLLLAANEFNCLNEILIIVSALSIQSPRERPIDKQEKSDKAHEQYDDENSDFIWFVNLWYFYQKQQKKLSQNKLRKLCQTNFLSYMRMREWADIHRQLRHVCTEMKFTINTDAASYQNIHCAILTGMPSHVAFLSDKHEYTGARDIKLNIFPASGQFNKKPKWIVAADLVETSRLYARNVASIESNWLINTAAHLLKYNYSDAHWESKSARVVALEKISLYGMTLVAAKRVNYGRVNPVESKALFIRNALVEGDLASSASFYKHNNKIINEVRELEKKSRRPDIVDEEAIYNFYDKALPIDVYDGQSFAAWAKKLNKDQKQALCLDKDMIMSHEAEHVTENLFPDTIQSKGLSIPVEYKFEPGKEDDGLNIDVPVAALKQFDEKQMDYLVPGLIEEKIIVLLRSLPKQIRTKIVPIPQTATECAKNITNRTVSLKQNLSAYLYKTRLVEIKDEDWPETVLPEHLKTNFRIIDSDNQLLGTGKDIAVLKEKFADKAGDAFTELYDNEFGTEEVTSWDFGELPVKQEIKINNDVIVVYPSLIEEEGKVYNHAFETKESADYYLRYGLRQLFKRELIKDIKYMRKNLRGIEKLALMYSNIGSKAELINEVVNLSIDETFLYNDEPIRKQDYFFATLEENKQNLLMNAEKVCILLETILDKQIKVYSRLSDADIVKHVGASCDIEEQMEYLIYGGFINDVPYKCLQQYPRYLDSILKRLEKLNGGLEKDKQSTKLIQEHWNRIKKLVDNAYATDCFTTSLYEYRWMIEELRISLFTQELKTKMPISVKRMDKMWDKYQKTI
ncbi:MAG: ATP-dependent RNA helicase HrpA [Proteobacteria bacterium]|nr:ATP-dependent RNA helicase HrpA [Pseudomonadota bacterium]